MRQFRLVDSGLEFGTCCAMVAEGSKRPWLRRAGHHKEGREGKGGACHFTYR